MKIASGKDFGAEKIARIVVHLTPGAEMVSRDSRLSSVGRPR